MAIDLTIPGDPASIMSLAQWLDPGVNNAVNDAHKALTSMSSNSRDFWRGKTGDAFRESVEAIAAGVDPVDIYVADAAEVFRAYAKRLERGKATFADYADSARSTWLTVTGMTIEAPIAPKQYMNVPGAPPPIERGPNGECIEQRPVGAYEDSKVLYNKIAEGVGSWWGELQNWIDEHMVPLITRVQELTPLQQKLNMLQKGNYATLVFLLNGTQAKWGAHLNHYEGEARKAQTAYETHAQRLRSGDPRINSAAEKLSKPELRVARDVLAGEVHSLKVGTRILPAVGPAIDIVLAGVEVANGGSASSATAGVLGGVAGGAVGVGAVAGGVAITGAVVGTVVAAPVVVTAAVVGGVAIAGAEGARWAWESGVPLDVREAIDAGDFGYAFK